ncbi:MAG: hypothetical protein HZB31_04255 [Nitrospirae bacterium]|nr:hypothetical protein [Nitrospirota bacterium]
MDQFDHYRPRVVVLIFCSYNDFVENSLNSIGQGEYYKPYFDRNKSMTLKGVPVPTSLSYFGRNHPWLVNSYVVRLIVNAFAPPLIAVDNPTPEIIHGLKTVIEQRGALLVVGLVEPHIDVENILRAEGIAYVQLYGAETFPANGWHWTPAGHTKVSAIMYDFLRRQALINTGKEKGPFRDIWIQPAAGDAGSAVGSALAVWHQYLDQPRQCTGTDSMQGSYLGPSFSCSEIRIYLDSIGASYQEMTENELYEKIAQLLAEEQVIGWFQGRMEFGPRALGGRSILGDARSPAMQSVMNLKIKYRESFRPFAPSVLEEDAAVYFELDRASPYMLLVGEVIPVQRISLEGAQERLSGIDKLKVVRSTIPAVTHVDYTARIQTVSEASNPRYYRLLQAFKALTGCSLLVNTSFNVRGEPLVCSPEDAYRCFMRTEMDYLVMENILFDKRSQPVWQENKNWQLDFVLD